MLGTHLFAAAAVVAAAGLGGVAPAPAARGPMTEMEFAVSPGEVRQGSRITLAGVAGWSGTKSGNAAPVDVFFRRTEKDPFARVARINAGNDGRFSTTLVAQASGDYEVVYRGNPKTGRGQASASDYIAVFTSRTVERLVYSWSGNRVQCQPVCRAQSPGLALGPGPVHVTFRRDCGAARSGGSLGFTRDPWNKHAAGDPGWRDFRDGAGPVEFDLAPPQPAGHFYLTWTSVQRERGQETLCDLSFRATQTATEIKYV